MKANPGNGLSLYVQKEYIANHTVFQNFRMYENSVEKDKEANIYQIVLLHFPKNRKTLWKHYFYKSQVSQDIYNYSCLISDSDIHA